MIGPSGKSRSRGRSRQVRQPDCAGAISPGVGPVATFGSRGAMGTPPPRGEIPKEVVGTDAQQDAAKKEAEADSARAGAKAAEQRQEAQQRP